MQLNSINNLNLFFQIFQLQFIQNNEWFLSNKNYSKITINLNNKLQDRLIYEFELTRHGAVHIYTIIVPALGKGRQLSILHLLKNLSMFFIWRRKNKPFGLVS